MSYIFLIFITAINLFFYKNYQKSLIITKYLIDEPDYVRKIHKKNAYQVGGIGFGITLIMIVFFNVFFDFQLMPNVKFFFLKNYSIVIVLFAILLLGMLDDIFNIKYYIKFTLLIFLNLIAVESQKYLIIDTISISIVARTIELGSYSIFFTLLCILLFTNALNMFDGMNLQSGIYLLTVFIFLIVKNIELNIFIPLAITLLLFLYYNLKGKIFLGDSGTMFISSIVSYSLIAGYNHGKVLHADEIFIFMIFPGLDMLRLFIIRIFNKKNPFEADRNHIHHIILDCTKSIGKTTLIIFTMYFVPQLLYYCGIANLFTIPIGIIAYLCTYVWFAKLSRA